MEAFVLKCQAGSHFHFGEISIDSDASLYDTSTYLHSDTLYSALVNTLAKVYETATVNALRHHIDTGVLRFSSVFHCLERNGDFLYFLPKPTHYQQYVDDDFKPYKRIKWISKQVWESGILPANWDQDCMVIDKKYLISKEEAKSFWGKTVDEMDKVQVVKKVTLPKVFVHKPSKKEGVFTVTNLEICRNESCRVHFYFLLDADESFKASDDYGRLMMGFRLLADSGIGGEKSTGCGQIKGTEQIPFSLQIEKPVGQSVLSLSIPEDEAAFDKYQFYQTLTRGGRKYGEGKQLKFIKMIQEGAYVSSQVKGKCTIIGKKKDHEVIRSGMAFCVPVGG